MRMIMQVNVPRGRKYWLEAIGHGDYRRLSKSITDRYPFLTYIEVDISFVTRLMDFIFEVDEREFLKYSLLNGKMQEGNYLFHIHDGDYAHRVELYEIEK